MNNYVGEERRKMPLSEEQIEAIAERAADKAMEKLTQHIYQEIGRGVVSKFLVLLGVCVVGLGIWLKAKNII